MDISILPVGPGPIIGDGIVGRAMLERCHALIGGHNGDSLLFGKVDGTKQRLRIQTIGRYEREPGCHGPYQIGWTDLPEAFGADSDGQLLTLMALSLSPAAQDDRDRAHLINLLRPAATKLTRLLEEAGSTIDGERQGILWHTLGLATSLLGDFTGSERWLEVAVHAHRTALLGLQRTTTVLPWAMAQNNLGQALHLLAVQHRNGRKRTSLLEQSIDAFQEASRVYRADAATSSYRRRTDANLAHAEGLLAKRPLAA